MAKKRKKTEEEEVIRMLEREGFSEVPSEKIKEEPYRTIYALPSCFDESREKCTRGPSQVREKAFHYSKKKPNKQ